MGVYFPDMKFPQNCGDCDLLYDCCACGVTHKRMDFETMDRERHPDCPAIAVPPHGALIDRAEFWAEINKICDRRDAGIITDLTCLNQILSALRHAPTIIPAEEVNKK